MYINIYRYYIYINMYIYGYIYIYIYIYIILYSSTKNVINANCLSFDNPFLTNKKDSKGFFWIFVKAYIIEAESKIQPILYSSWPIRLQIVCTLAKIVCIYVFFLENFNWNFKSTLFIYLSIYFIDVREDRYPWKS